MIKSLDGISVCDSTYIDNRDQVPSTGSVGVDSSLQDDSTTAKQRALAQRSLEDSFMILCYWLENYPCYKLKQTGA